MIQRVSPSIDPRDPRVGISVRNLPPPSQKTMIKEPFYAEKTEFINENLKR